MRFVTLMLKMMKKKWLLYFIAQSLLKFNENFGFQENISICSCFEFLPNGFKKKLQHFLI